MAEPAATDRPATATATPAPCPGCWRPRPTTFPWQWQLQGRIDLSVPARIYDVDGLDTPARTVRALQRKRRRVVCYISVGTWERFRDDAAAFPAETRGKSLDDFPDERWLDIRRIDLLAPALEARLDICRGKGFDAVEPDNVDGFENDTGFPLRARDQLAFNRWIADEAHERGMAVALKNDGTQVRELLPWFDFAIVEECFEQRACRPYRSFVRARKAVLVAEYGIRPSRFCRGARRERFSAIFKRPSLGRFRRTCR